MLPEERQPLLDAMREARLSEKKLAILYMAAFGWTQEEIGEVLGLDQSNVSRHHTDAVCRLRELVSQPRIF